MARALREHPSTARIASRAVRAKMLATIGKQLQPSDRDDVVQKSYVRLLTLVDKLPETEDGLLGLVVVIVRGQVVSHFRRKDVEQSRFAPNEETTAADEPEVDLTPEQREEFRQLYEFAKQTEADGEMDADCLRWAEALAHGDDYATIAARENVPEATLRKRMQRFRRHLRARWKEYSGIGGAVLAALAVYFTRHREPDITATHDTYVAPSATSSAPAVESPQEKAASLRKQAADLCNRGYYDECEARLDQAKDLDRDGEDKPDVIRLRHQIFDHNNPPTLKKGR